MKFINNFLQNTIDTIKRLDNSKIERIIETLSKTRKARGRLFIIGVGGSAGNASHAVNDFRKLCNIDAYTPVDNISEITAKTNDEGFDTIFDTYLKLCNFDKKDVLLVLSVGGGNFKKQVSVNLINAIKFAKKRKGKVISVVGKVDGYAYKNSDISLLVNTNIKNLVTPLSETFQVLIWHLLVSHPKLKQNKTKW